MLPKYKPSRGDEIYSEHAHEVDPFVEAILLRDVSDEYLSVLLLDHQAESSRGTKLLVDFEVQRRAAKRGDKAILVSAMSALVATLALFFNILKDIL